MTIKYTKEQLNKFDKDLLIELFLGMQGQMEELSRQTQALNDRMHVNTDFGIMNLTDKTTPVIGYIISIQ